jgi:hypothetical protein
MFLHARSLAPVLLVSTLALTATGCATNRLWKNAKSGMPKTLHVADLENAAVDSAGTLHLAVRYDDGSLCAATSNVLTTLSGSSQPRARAGSGLPLPMTTVDVTILPSHVESTGGLGRYASELQRARRAGGIVLWLRRVDERREVAIIDTSSGGARRLNVSSNILPDRVVVLPSRSTGTDSGRLAWTAVATPFTVAFDAASLPVGAFVYAMTHGVNGEPDTCP